MREDKYEDQPLRLGLNRETLDEIMSHSVWRMYWLMRVQKVRVVDVQVRLPCAQAHWQDSKLVDNASTALANIVEALAQSKSAEQLDLLEDTALFPTIVQHVSVTESGQMTSQLSPTAYYMLIKALTYGSRGSPAVAQTILICGIASTIHSLLSK